MQEPGTTPARTQPPPGPGGRLSRGPPRTELTEGDPLPRAAADGLGPFCLGLPVASCTFTHCRTAPPPPAHPQGPAPTNASWLRGRWFSWSPRVPSCAWVGTGDCPSIGTTVWAPSLQPPASPPPAPTAARGTPHTLDITCPTSPGLQLWGRPSSDSGAGPDVAREPMPHPVLPLS